MTDARADFEAASVETRRIPANRTLDTVTAEEWRGATIGERREFIRSRQGPVLIAVGCRRCGFPAGFGLSSCEACT